MIVIHNSETSLIGQPMVALFRIINKISISYFLTTAHINNLIPYQNMLNIAIVSIWSDNVGPFSDSE